MLKEVLLISDRKTNKVQNSLGNIKSKYSNVVMVVGKSLETLAQKLKDKGLKITIICQWIHDVKRY